MFDITEYYKNNVINENEVLQGRLFDIDEEIFYEIDKIIKKAGKALYASNMYKYNKHNIEILTPSIEYSPGQKYLKGPDYIRFLLSMYPDKERLLNIDKIIIRPKYISSETTELVALYIRNIKTLVQYISYPHNYMLKSKKIKKYSRFTPYNLTRMINNNFLGLGINIDENEVKIPPLLYIISKVEPKSVNENEIDKFFLRLKTEKNYEIVTLLEEISAFYSHYEY